MLVRAAVPGPPRARPLRIPKPGFKPCRNRVNCALCKHNPGPTSSYTFPITGFTIQISKNITCTDVGVYLLLCRKNSGQCLNIHPIYVGECGDGVTSSFSHRLSSHLASATNPSQEETTKPVGCHFRLPGHCTNRDLVMLPLEKILDPYVRKAREAFLIKKFQSLKRLTVEDIEHGLNISPGLTY